MRRVSVNSDVERRGWTHLAEVCAVLNFSFIICSWIKYRTRVSEGFLYQDISGDPLFLLSIPNSNMQWLRYLIFYCQWFVEIHAELQSTITCVSVFIRMHQTCLVTDHLCAPEKLPGTSFLSFTARSRTGGSSRSATGVRTWQITCWKVRPWWCKERCLLLRVSVAFGEFVYLGENG